MATSYTSFLGLALPVTGELQGTWGDVVNDSITSLLDSAIAGTTTLSTDGDVTLTTTNGASNQAREAILLCSGARTALRTITAPAQSKIYTIINATTGGYAVKLVGAGPTTGLTIPNGASAVVAWNGSDFIEIGSSTIGNLVVNGNLSVTGTTTLTGAATLTANPTLSAGTANGVAYLNGSKVLTTGSALTFDGTTFRNLPGAVASGGTANGKFRLDRSDGATNLGYIDWITAGDGLRFYNNNGGYFSWEQSSAGEMMRLTSTGLGIGTSSPSAKLDVVGGNVFCGNGTIKTTLSYATTGIVGTFSNHALSIYTNTAEVARFDTSGNLGLGVTPSAWLANGRMEIPSSGGFFAQGAVMDVGTNWYYGSSGFTYKTTAAAAWYQQNSGAHKWFNAPSGTAGNAISFTQAMTLDASGNLMVGGTSASGRFTLTTAEAKAQNATPFVISTTDASNKFELIFARATNSSYKIQAVEQGVAYRDIVMQNDGGNLGIGTSSPASKLDVYGAANSDIRVSSGSYGYLLLGQYSNGAFIGTSSTDATAGVLRLGTGGTERARIDSSGNMMVGKSTGSSRLNVEGTGSNNLAVIASNATYTTSSGDFVWAYEGIAPNLVAGSNVISIIGKEKSQANSGYMGYKWNASGSDTNLLTFGHFGIDNVMNLTAGGHLLVGRQTSKYTGNWSALGLGNGAFFSGPEIGSDNNCLIASNAYYDGSWKRVNSGYTSLLEMLFGGTQVQFFTATTGAADSAISWTSGPYVANGSNTWTNGSDEKLKNITGEIEDAVAKVMQLRAARYTWKSDSENKPQVGLIAQDLQKVLPEVVVVPVEEKDQYGNDTYLGVNYDHVIPLLVAAIKEQQGIINQLKARLDAANL